MRVLFLVHGRERPSTRYRVFQYLPYLEGNGIRTKVIPFPRGLKDTFRLYPLLKGHDVVFLQRRRPSWPVLQLLKAASRRLIYDFDDAIMYRNSSQNPFSATRRRAFARTVKICERVIAGNSFLAEEAKKYTEKVAIVPTVIDVRKYPVKGKRGGDKITIGWIGSASTLPYLQDIRPVFEELGKKYRNLQLKIICDSFFDCESLPVIKKPWKEEEEVDDLKSCDIGVTPSRDDLWSRGKCNLKTLQYLAVGVPVVCTPVGSNRDIVRDGINGFWARNLQEWVEKLSVLIEDPSLRERMGVRGREIVEEEFSLDVWAPRFCRILEGS